MVKVKVLKLNPKAELPKYMLEGDAGCDLVAVSKTFEVNEHGRDLEVYGTGLAFEIPKGHIGLIFPRSSIYKTNLSLTNCVGVIDSNYRGEIKFKFFWTAENKNRGDYKIGDRIGQLIVLPYPTIEFEESLSLSDSNRGSGGFGSTGN
jgi:dUTP pyrophosphatase